MIQLAAAAVPRFAFAERPREWFGRRLIARRRRRARVGKRPHGALRAAQALGSAGLVWACTGAQRCGWCQTSRAATTMRRSRYPSGGRREDTEVCGASGFRSGSRPAQHVIAKRQLATANHRIKDKFRLKSPPRDDRGGGVRDVARGQEREIPAERVVRVHGAREAPARRQRAAALERRNRRERRALGRLAPRITSCAPHRSGVVFQLEGRDRACSAPPRVYGSAKTTAS